MIVLSDTKKRIRNVEELVIVQSSGVWEIRSLDSNFSLGTYSTLFRAQEILFDYLKMYRQNFLLKYCSEKLTSEEFEEYSKKIVFVFPPE